LGVGSAALDEEYLMYDWRGRRALVTGATGILGSWLCEELVRRGATVVAFVLDDDPRSRFYRDGIDASCAVVNGNLADFDACARALNSRDVEIVFHLGAQTVVGAAFRDPLECFESNIRGTYNLLEAARRLPGLVERFVVASSDKAYGESPILPYKEDMPLNGTHPYDVSKSCADLLALAYAHTYGMAIAVARCGNIYGGGDLNWSRIVPGTIRSLLRGEKPVLRSDGTMIRDYVYVRDVVDAYVALAEQLDRADVAGQAFNIGPGSQITVLQIVDAIGEAMGVRIEPEILNNARAEIVNQSLDSAKAARVLGWQNRYTLSEGLRETVAWYRDYLAEPRARADR
jgi:CDP-glucose 4,6-dehydratase